MKMFYFWETGCGQRTGETKLLSAACPGRELVSRLCPAIPGEPHLGLQRGMRAVFLPKLSSGHWHVASAWEQSTLLGHLGTPLEHRPTLSRALPAAGLNVWFFESWR